MNVQKRVEQWKAAHKDTLTQCPTGVKLTQAACERQQAMAKQAVRDFWKNDRIIHCMDCPKRKKGGKRGV